MTDQLDFSALKSAGNLPSPKGVALTVMQLCQQEDIQLSKIAHAIRGDPALAGRIIKMANAINPNKRRPIASVSPETLIIIGTNTVQQIVLGFSLVNTNPNEKCVAFDYAHFWSHSIAMATAAQAIGSTTRIAPPAELFTCGLLSGVGRIALASVKPDAYTEVLQQTNGMDNAALVAAEKKRFGIHHAELSHMMMSDWGLPRFYTEAVLFHEAPETSWFAPGSRQAKLTWSIHLASLIAEACLLQDEQGRDVLMAQICSIGDTLDMSVIEIISIADQTAKEWREWGELLKIETHDIPAFKPPSSSGHEAAPPFRVGANLPPLRILVVDDDMMTFMFNRMLGAVGHTVFTSTKGRDALEIALREKPDVVISDWITPEFDGAALCRALRDTPEGKHMYFILLSGETDESKELNALRAGADAYLHEPFDPEQIHAELVRADQRRISKN